MYQKAGCWGQVPSIYVWRTRKRLNFVEEDEAVQRKAQRFHFPRESLCVDDMNINVLAKESGFRDRGSSCLDLEIMKKKGVDIQTH